MLLIEFSMNKTPNKIKQTSFTVTLSRRGSSSLYRLCLCEEDVKLHLPLYIIPT